MVCNCKATKTSNAPLASGRENKEKHRKKRSKRSKTKGIKLPKRCSVPFFQRKSTSNCQKNGKSIRLLPQIAWFGTKKWRKMTWTFLKLSKHSKKCWFITITIYLSLDWNICTFISFLNIMLSFDKEYAKNV